MFKYWVLFEFFMYIIVFNGYYILFTLKPIHRDPKQFMCKKVLYYILFAIGAIVSVGLGYKSFGYLFYLWAILCYLYREQVLRINGLLDE